MSLIQYQVRHAIINFQHRPIKCVNNWYQCRRSYNSSSHAWWTQLSSNSTRKIQGQYYSMQKEDLSKDRSWGHLFQILSSQTCGFTYLISSPRETSHPKEHWWRFKGPQRKFWKKTKLRIMRRTKMCTLFWLSWQPITSWMNKSPLFNHCSNYSGRRLLWCMDICYKTLWKWEFSYSSFWFWSVLQYSGTWWLFHNKCYYLRSTLTHCQDS